MKPSYAAATVLYCAAIFWLSSQPEPIQTARHFPGADKVAHVLLYGGLAAVASTGVRRSDRPVAPAWQFWAPLIFASLYGVSDEIHQIYVPRRTFDLFDIAANVAGAAIAQLILCRYVWKLRPFSGRA